MNDQVALDVRLSQAVPIPLDASFACGAGGVLALVGPSGSGKSTILRSIAGLYRPAAGQVRCNGEVWLDTERGTDVSPQHRRVGMLFQSYALFPHLSALDNVRLAVESRPGVDPARRAAELLETVHLGGLAGRLPRQLSGGQQQRVALARALAREPSVLLLDEPFSAVDQVTRRKLRLEMAQLTRQLAMPIVLVTHDLDEAQMLADRMVVLHNGRTLQQGAPLEVLRRPADATVARLVDVRNLFRAELVSNDTGEGARLHWQGVDLEVEHAPGLAVGAEVSWCIPPGDVLLHRKVLPSRGTRENPLRGTIVEMVTIGDATMVMLSPSHAPGLRVHMDLPIHVVRRNALTIGEEIGVSLLKGAIHLMRQ